MDSSKGFLQTNGASIEYSVKTLQFLFLINGAAATALLATGNVVFYTSAIWLAIGAMLAVLTFGVSYLYSLLISVTWSQEENKNKKYEVYFLFKKRFLTLEQIENLRLVPIIFTLFSIVCFFRGIYLCSKVI